jgi:hypothetical protein
VRLQFTSQPFFNDKPCNSGCGRRTVCETFVSDACLRLLAQGGSIRINKLAAVNDLARQSRAPCGRNCFDCGIDRVFNKQHSVVFARVKRGGMVTCGLGSDWVQKADAASTRGLSRERTEIVEDRRIFWMMLQKVIAMRYPPTSGIVEWKCIIHCSWGDIPGVWDALTSQRVLE